MMLESLFGHTGITGHSIDQRDLRPLTNEEIQQMQLAQLHGVQNCQNPYNNLSGNYIPYQTIQRPLDERFADFKVRLAEAIDRRAQLVANTASS